MAYLKVRLLNDSKDKSTADIVPKQTDYGVYPMVYSQNKKMKGHIESLLREPAYVAAPGVNTTNFFSDTVLELQPNTLYYFQALPEILSWRGYRVSVINETHKSVDYEDISMDTLKAADASTDAIIYNDKGERVVKYVPAGYVAVSHDGKTVAGGRYLNANIDKEGANWTLVENPHEQNSPEQRKETKQYMDAGLQEYHPGVENEMYNKRSSEDDEDYHKIERKYKPKGKTLQEHFATGKTTPKENMPETYPAYLEPGNVVYSPQTGQAFDSEHWPPNEIDYEKHDWYVFEGSNLSDEEKEFYAPISGLTPTLITGLGKGIVQSEKGLDVSNGYKLERDMPDDRMGEMADGTDAIKINKAPEGKLEMRDMINSEWKEKYREIKEKLRDITALTHKEVSEDLENMKIEGLRGVNATFSYDLYDYQKAVVSAMTLKDQYEAFGGPKGWHGYFLNVKMGLGKTAMVAAANAVLRNNGTVKNGEQTTIVTAPNKNIYVWQSEIGKFLGEHAVVIDGDRQTRVDQWEDVVAKARSGELPSFLVLGSSKFRYVRSDRDEDDDEQDTWELDTDAKYMKLLSMGGSSHSGDVKGNHVGILVVDESAQYVNPDSARHEAIKSVIDSVYYGKGITWTLNGNISGNSATDTISDLSFINKFIRDNYLAVVHEYTKTNREAFRESKEMGRRIWKDYGRLKDFLYTFGPQVYSLDGRTVAGDDYGLKRTEDTLAPLGPEWGSVYFEAERKLAAASSGKEMSRAFGLLSILINSSFGSVAPQRMFEYDVGTENMFKTAAKFLAGQDLDKLREEHKEYVDKVTESSPYTGRLPKKGMSIQERDNIYKSTLSAASRSALSKAVNAWESPVVSSIITDIKTELQQNAPSGKKMKMGIAGFSKQAINRIARELRDKYPPTNFLIQVVDGDVPAEDVKAIQEKHQNEEDRHVITLVTGAGLYGLSLPSERSWRFPTWNSSKGSQYEARFHRKAEQKNITTVVLPEGITQYMRELEMRKGEMASAATNVLLEVDDSEDELAIKASSVTRLLDKLAQYRPRVLGDE